VVLAFVWPAGLFKLTIIKNYLFFLHAIFVKGYSTQSFFEVWVQRVISSPIEYIVIIFSLGFFLFNFIKCQKTYQLTPFVVYAALLLFTVVGNTSTSPTYISSLMPPLYIISGIALAQVIGLGKMMFKTCSVIFIVSILLTNNYFYLSKAMYKHQGNNLNKILMLPTIHYYFPQLELSSYTEELHIDNIIDRLESENFDGLVYMNGNNELILKKIADIFYVRTAYIFAHEGNYNIAYYQLKKK
jgi:hypothetical protein